jgi:prepilin-type N-terminal cleavage/methylation domain-containing protein
MAKHSLFSRLKQIFHKRRDSKKGFTLIELLVVVAIAGGILSGLTYIVVELMGADQREASRSETQRDMQSAMNYISAELQQAVFVYTGNYMTQLANYLPTSLTTNSTPVLAFWKYKPLPDSIKTSCAAAATNASAVPPAGVPCMAGQSYALVVYSLSTANQGNPWVGKSRITRYELSQFTSTGTAVSGYVSPTEVDNFDNWPMKQNASLQTARPTGSPDVLVDFVDNTANGGSCPANDSVRSYTVSPPTPQGFYACISTSTATNQQTTGAYQDVVLYVQGNASGKYGIRIPANQRTNSELLPALETRVLLRGVLWRTPEGS